VADLKARNSGKPVAARAPSAVVPGAEAARDAFAPLAWNEAPRIGILGDSGTGKTEAAQVLVSYYLDQVPGVAIVIDDKHTPARFKGQERRDVAELGRRPPAAEPRVIVIRGSILEGETVDAESVARFGWALAARRRQVLIVYDELARAADDYGMWLPGVTRVPAAFGQGRSIGISSIWSTQSPQQVPRAAFEQSSVILCFRLAGMGLALLRRRDYLGGADVERAIESLPGDDVPPAERGVFVLLRRGRPWDGRRYRFARR
jgi:DNA helicase HerA-like ATPase